LTGTHNLVTANWDTLVIWMSIYIHILVFFFYTTLMWCQWF